MFKDSECLLWQLRDGFVLSSTQGRTASNRLMYTSVVGNEDVCRIELNGGTFMEAPPPGNIRDIMQAYARYAEDIRKTWETIHGV